MGDVTEEWGGGGGRNGGEDGWGGGLRILLYIESILSGGVKIARRRIIVLVAE